MEAQNKCKEQKEKCHRMLKDGNSVIPKHTRML